MSLLLIEQESTVETLNAEEIATSSRAERSSGEWRWKSRQLVLVNLIQDASIACVSQFFSPRKNHIVRKKKQTLLTIKTFTKLDYQKSFVFVRKKYRCQLIEKILMALESYFRAMEFRKLLFFYNKLRTAIEVLKKSRKKNWTMKKNSRVFSSLIINWSTNFFLANVRHKNYVHLCHFYVFLKEQCKNCIRNCTRNLR